jgi:hypothetical protein
MKKNILLLVAIALVGTGTFTWNTLRAQNDATPAPQQPTVPPPGNPGPRPGGITPGFRGRAGMMNYRNTVMMLKRVKADLENSKEDYDGHRQSAIDACDKAMQELEAVQKSIQAAQAAKAAAARAAAAQQTPPPDATPAPAAPNQ